MAVKTSDEGYERLKKDIKENTLGNLYVFHGEENWLKEYYFSAVKKQLVADAFQDFNYRVFDEGKLDLNELSSSVDALPMMAARTMIVVKDWDFFKASEDARNKLTEILSDLPDYCCLIFFYSNTEFKIDSRMRKLAELIKNNACVVNFIQREQNEMFSWIRRRFKEQGKDIDKTQSEYLMFLCGGLMTNLQSEIRKIAAYSSNALITRQDIDAVATPVIEAVVFDLTDALSAGQLDRSMGVLGRLLLMREEPIKLLAVIAGQMRNLYLTRMCLDRGKNEQEIAQILGFKSSYPARKLIQTARKLTSDACMDAVKLCSLADPEMKQNGADKEGILKLLVVHLCRRTA